MTVIFILGYAVAALIFYHGIIQQVVPDPDESQEQESKGWRQVGRTNSSTKDTKK